MQHLNDEIKKKMPHLAKNKFLFYQDNAPAHIYCDHDQNQWVKAPLASSHTLFIWWSPFELLSIYIFKKMAVWTKICQYWEVEFAVDNYFEKLDHSHYKKGIDASKYHRENIWFFPKFIVSLLGRVFLRLSSNTIKDKPLM